jgi:hypothetical protein
MSNVGKIYIGITTTGVTVGGYGSGVFPPENATATPVGDWILTTGFWADSGVWDDTASWID